MGIGRSVRSLADRAKSKIRPGQAGSAIDKAGDKFDDATGGKHASKVGKAQDKAKDAADKHLRDER
jgi:hypothetical protein